MAIRRENKGGAKGLFKLIEGRVFILILLYSKDLKREKLDPALLRRFPLLREQIEKCCSIPLITDALMGPKMLLSGC
jgi:hypothetical protein